MSRIRSLAARNPSEVGVEVHLGDPNSSSPAFRYSLGIRQENRGKRRVLVAYEKAWKGEELILDRPEEPDKKDEERLTRTYLENPTTNSKFREIAELFSSVSYLHLVPQLLRSVKSVELEQAGDDYYGRNFMVRVSQTPEKVRKARLNRILEALAQAVPQFDELKDEKDEAGVPHLLLRLKHWRPDAGWQSEDQFSDGTIRMLGLFWSMLEGDAILLFEEPELSLNDKIVEQLAGLLWKLQASKGRQVILTTHSLALLADPGISPEEVIVLSAGNESTIAESADSIEEVKRLVKEGHLSIGEAVLPRTAPQPSGPFFNAAARPQRSGYRIRCESTHTDPTGTVISRRTLSRLTRPRPGRLLL
jgi:predicted ATPase